MGIFERAQETGFLDLDGFDGPSQSYFAASAIQEKWSDHCQERGLPVLVLGAGFGGRNRCHVEFSCDDREMLVTIVGQRGLVAVTERTLTELTEGSWISEQVSRDEALAIIAEILEDLALLRRHDNGLAN